MINKTDFNTLLKSSYNRGELCYLLLMALDTIQEKNNLIRLQTKGENE